MIFRPALFGLQGRLRSARSACEVSQGSGGVLGAVWSSLVATDFMKIRGLGRELVVHDFLWCKRGLFWANFGSRAMFYPYG